VPKMPKVAKVLGGHLWAPKADRGWVEREHSLAPLALAAALLLAGCGGATSLPGFLAPAPAPLKPVPGGDPRQGVRAAQQYGCGSCHAIPGLPGAHGAVGPPLGGIARRAIIAGHLPNTPENMMRWIANPQAVNPGSAMPDLGLSAADVRDIAAYLYTLE
jgi:cytochrome c